MSESLVDKRVRLLQATEKGIDELIKVIESAIVTHGEDDISADKMKNAAAAKKLALDDALYMLDIVDKERQRAEDGPLKEITVGKGGFAEGRSKKNGRR